MAEATFNVASIEACVALVVSLERSLTNRVLANSSSDASELTAALCKKLRKLHLLVVSDGEHCDIAVTLIRANFFSTVSFSASTILKFSFVTEEVLRVVLPLIRLQQQEVRGNVMAQFLSNGGLIFCLVALKQHMQQSSSIRVQGCELLAAVLDHVTKSQQQQEQLDNENDQQGENHQQTMSSRHAGNYPGSVARHQRRTVVQDTVHQLLLNGAAATLCRLLNLSVNNMHEMSVRRAISCLTFLILETPPDLATKVASYENWSVVKALHTVLREMSLSARVDAAALLTGLLASDIQVAERIHGLGIWDELSSTLAQNASVIKVPKQWLRVSLEKIRLVNDNRPGGFANDGSGSGSGSGAMLPPSASFLPAPATKRDEPVFSYSFGLDGGVDGSSGSLVSEKVGFEDIVNALLDTHAAVDAGTRRSPGGGLGMLSAKHLEAQLQRHVAKAKLSFSGFGEMQEIYLPTKRPQSASASKKKASAVPLEPNYIKNLKASPLGYPLDPAQYRKEMRENGGRPLEYVPAALGGKALGRRPGAPAESFTEGSGAAAGNKTKGSTRRQQQQLVPKLSADKLPSASSNEFLPSKIGPKASKPKPVGSKSSTALTDEPQLQQQQRGQESDKLQSTSKATMFVAQRLFSDEDTTTPTAISRPQTSNAIDRLSFAERLQCMIMQVKDKMATSAV